MVAVIKDAIQQSGLSLSELAKRSGINHAQLSRFMRGERSLTLETAEKLCDHLPVEVVLAPPPEDDEQEDASKTSKSRSKK